MKKIRLFLCMLSAVILIGCGSKGGKSEPVYSSPDEVTVKDLIKVTTPTELVKSESIFSFTGTYSNAEDATLEGAFVKQTYFVTSAGVIESNYYVTYPDGYVTNAFFSNDASDRNYYYIEDTMSGSMPLDEDYIATFFGESVLGYTEADTKINDISEENGKYIAHITSGLGTIDTVTIDPETGYLLSVESDYDGTENENTTHISIVFDYSKSQSIDRSALEASNGSSSGNAESNSPQNTQSYFNATDIYGNEVTDDIVKNAKVIMLNYWEPWCGPCVNEMPDLQKLYEKYKDQGFVVVGVYSTFDMDEDAMDIVTGNNITYPILRTNDVLETLAQDYYPATYFMDGSQNLLHDEPYIGSRSYEEWETIILSYLN